MSLGMVKHAENILNQTMTVLPRKMDTWLTLECMTEALCIDKDHASFLRGVEWRGKV